MCLRSLKGHEINALDKTIDHAFNLARTHVIRISGRLLCALDKVKKESGIKCIKALTRKRKGNRAG